MPELQERERREEERGMTAHVTGDIRTASVCTGCPSAVNSINGLWCPVVRGNVQYAMRRLCETTT